MICSVENVSWPESEPLRLTRIEGKTDFIRNLIYFSIGDARATLMEEMLDVLVRTRWFNDFPNPRGGSKILATGKWREAVVIYCTSGSKIADNFSIFTSQLKISHSFLPGRWSQEFQLKTLINYTIIIRCIIATLETLRWEIRIFTFEHQQQEIVRGSYTSGIPSTLAGGTWLCRKQMEDPNNVGTKKNELKREKAQSITRGKFITVDKRKPSVNIQRSLAR